MEILTVKFDLINFSNSEIATYNFLHTLNTIPERIKAVSISTFLSYPFQIENFFLSSYIEL